MNRYKVEKKNEDYDHLLKARQKDGVVVGWEETLQIPVYQKGSGGGSSTVEPNTVDSDAIVDDSILAKDLNPDVRSRLNEGFATSDDIAEIFR